MPRRERPRIALLPTSPLLIIESEGEFDRVCSAFDQEINPRGIIERMYVADVVYLTWEIVRLRRCKASIIINVKFRDALKSVLRRLSDIGSEISNAAGDLSYDWFTDQDARKKVWNLLAEFQLDETAVEGEAVRESLADLEQLDRLLASAESRRNRALRCITEYRESFAKRLRESSNRIIDGKILALENRTNKKPSTAA
jgi:hypothetical protein